MGWRHRHPYLIMKHILSSIAIGALGLPAQAAQPPRPNIIHIMADDLGWRDLSCYGSETFQTPHIDALAKRGMLFSNAYAASPLCSPTRAATLTGQTVGRIRLTTPGGHVPEVVLDVKERKAGSPGFPATEPETRTRIPMESVTMSKVLKGAGYRNAFIGKWHLGHDPYIPENFGFDVVIGGRGTPGPPAPGFFGPWPKEANFPPTTGNPNADDVMGDAAVDYIAKNADAPFFMCFWPYNVHAPFQAKPRDIEEARPRTEGALHQDSAIMAAMVKSLDDNVGKIVQELEKRAILDNTLIIFTSDNGGNMYDRPEGRNPTHNHPLRAGKGNNYEGGTRVPLIVSWPGVVSEGTFSDAVSISYDWFPTVLDVAGLKPPADWVLDGKSLLPAMRGEQFERGPIFSIFGHNVAATGNLANVWVRDGKWKLLRFFHSGPDQTDEFELYDLDADPGETHNLAAAIPKVVEQLATVLADHLAESKTLLPRLNPQYNPNLRQAGFEMIRGGFLVGGAEKEGAEITAKHQSVTLRYHPPADATGDKLRIQVTSNCARSIIAARGKALVFGPPARITPDPTEQTVTIPLGQSSGTGTITLVLELTQPGRILLAKAELVN